MTLGQTCQLASMPARNKRKSRQPTNSAPERTFGYLFVPFNAEAPRRSKHAVPKAINSFVCLARLGWGEVTNRLTGGRQLGRQLFCLALREGFPTTNSWKGGVRAIATTTLRSDIGIFEGGARVSPLNKIVCMRKTTDTKKWE